MPYHINPITLSDRQHAHKRESSQASTVDDWLLCADASLLRPRTSHYPAAHARSVSMASAHPWFPCSHHQSSILETSVSVSDGAQSASPHLAPSTHSESARVIRCISQPRANDRHISPSCLFVIVIDFHITVQLLTHAESCRRSASSRISSNPSTSAICISSAFSQSHVQSGTFELLVHGSI